MPSASAKLEKQTSTETLDPVKQVLTIIEKKVRNLEKRKGKLDSYRQESENGKELNDDQKKAVEKYDQVVEVLEFTKELQKQFQTVIQDCSKAQKKAAKREQLERQQAELQRIKEILAFQDLLNSMGGDDVRNDFLNGTNGAVKLTEEELNNIDELYKALCPERSNDKEDSDFDNNLSAAADHFQALLDSKNKEAFGTTYKTLHELLKRIESCSYFSKSESEVLVEAASEDHPVGKDNDVYNESLDSHQHENDLRNVDQVSESSVSHSGISSQVERPYYQSENCSLYSEQTHPIQDVLSVQGNLNFLQESQIEVESSRANSEATGTPTGTSYPNVQFSVASQNMTATNMVSHCTRRLSNETPSLPPNPTTGNLMLPNTSTLQQVGGSMPASVPLAPSSQPIDFDPARPIPTQTYTNQSFSSGLHPMMAAAVSQNYVPIATLPHTMPPPPHGLSQSMVVQPLSPRSTVNTSLSSNPNLQMAPTHTSQLGSENAQQSLSSQYDCSNMQENNIVKNSNTFVNTRDSRPVQRENRPRGAANAYTRGHNQMGYGTDQGARGSSNTVRGNNVHSSRGGYRN